MMNIIDCIELWESKKRRMGCVAATNWFCKKVKDFKPERLNRYTKEGILYQHVVATNGKIRIDLAPYNDIPINYDPKTDGYLINHKE